MKHLKKYEDVIEKITDVAELHDYVMVDPYCSSVKELQEYFKTAIGKLIDISEAEILYYVHFENIPDNVAEFICWKEPFRKKSIIVWGKTEEEVKIKLQTNKYNL